jgi:hypothetical protein
MKKMKHQRQERNAKLKMETSKNRAFSVSEYTIFVYDYEMPGYITTFDYIDGLYFRTFKLVKNRVE